MNVEHDGDMLEEIRRETVIDCAACLQCMYNAKPSSAYWARTNNSRKNEEQKDRKYDVDTKLEPEREREKVSWEWVGREELLATYTTALTVAQSSSIRQADNSETSSTPSRTLLPSFKHTTFIYIMSVYTHFVSLGSALRTRQLYNTNILRT